MEIIVRKDFTSHYNRALRKPIRTKREYNNEMRKQRMVSYEEGSDIAQKARAKAHKDYTISKETERFLSEVKDRSKDGKVKLSGRELGYMEKIGVNFRRPEEKPLKGGFN